MPDYMTVNIRSHHAVKKSDQNITITGDRQKQASRLYTSLNKAGKYEKDTSFYRYIFARNESHPG